MSIPGFDNCLADRFNKILEIMKAQGIDGLLLNSEANISYVAGFHAPDSYMLIGALGGTLITDFRYTCDFEKKVVSPIKVLEYRSSIFKTIARTIRQEAIKKTGFESRHLTFAECEILNDLAGKSSKFIPLKETIEPLREVKDEEEIANMKRAIEITLKTFSFIEKKLKPGLAELEVVAEIERFIRLQGACASAFNIIVASGPNSSFPHAGISQRVMKKGEPVVIDMGVEYNGYKCDLTRTFFLGKITPLVQKVAHIVHEAQIRAIKIIRPGTIIKDIDSAARYYIAGKGFGKNFGHALGHGVGLEVHESPSINRKNNHRIRKGMIFTVEPAIYIAGAFGVRREDMVLVTDTGVEVL